MDVRTLLVSITCLEISLFAGMLIYWRSQRTYPGFGPWTFCNLAMILGCLLLGLEGWLPLAFTETVGNTLFVVAAQFRLRAIRDFLDVPVHPAWEWLLAPVALAGLAWFTLVDPSWPLRTLVVSLPIALLALLAVKLLWGARSIGLRTLYRVSAGAILVYVAALLARAILVLPLPPETSLFMVSPLQSLYFLIGVMVEVFWNLTFVMLNSQRLAIELTETRNELARLAATDPLTGALNRRSLFSRGGREFTRALRHGRSLAALAIDLDRFKQVNDTLGHAAGDRVLRATVQVCQQQLRTSDLLGRMGGDEFVALLPETGAEGARQVAERLRQAVDRELIGHQEGLLQTMSISVGLSVSHPDDASLDELLERADLALYQAKQAGRQCLVALERVQTEEPPPPQTGAAPGAQTG
ncbi:MAG: GGDEF domain-containing protein [Desulfarculus sp.]|nr:GGDEF domain-containing protein [Desulfarculus sp.]